MLFGNSNYMVARDKHQGKVIRQVHEWVTSLWSFYRKRLKNSLVPWEKAQKCSSTSNSETLRWLTCVQPSINSDAQGEQRRHQTGHSLAKWMQYGSTTWTQGIAHFTDLLGTSLLTSQNKPSFSRGLTCRWTLLITSRCSQNTSWSWHTGDKENSTRRFQVPTPPTLIHIHRKEVRETSQILQENSQTEQLYKPEKTESRQGWSPRTAHD